MPIKSTLTCVVLLATLKKKASNTETLVNFLAEKMRAGGIDVEKIKLVERKIPAGTYSDMGAGDEWPEILEKVVAADILIFATPVWWGGHSSEMQRVIERLDEIHDEILAGKKSRLEGKPLGVVVTGDSDGAQHIIGNLANFGNAVGMMLPPFATLTVLWEGHKKGEEKSPKELLKYCEKEYAETADTMIEQLKKAAGNS